MEQNGQFDPNTTSYRQNAAHLLQIAEELRMIAIKMHNAGLETAPESDSASNEGAISQDNHQTTGPSSVATGEPENVQSPGPARAAQQADVDPRNTMLLKFARILTRRRDWRVKHAECCHNTPGTIALAESGNPPSFYQISFLGLHISDSLLELALSFKFKPSGKSQWSQIRTRFHSADISMALTWMKRGSEVEWEPSQDTIFLEESGLTLFPHVEEEAIPTERGINIAVGFEKYISAKIAFEKKTTTKEKDRSGATTYADSGIAWYFAENTARHNGLAVAYLGGVKLGLVEGLREKALRLEIHSRANLSPLSIYQIGTQKNKVTFLITCKQ